MARERRPPQKRKKPDPAVAREWQRIGIDTLAAVVAVFLFVYGAITIREPAVLAMFFGFGVTLLGIPVARRVDTGRNGNGKDG